MPRTLIKTLFYNIIILYYFIFYSTQLIHNCETFFHILYTISTQINLILLVFLT